MIASLILCARNTCAICISNEKLFYSLGFLALTALAMELAYRYGKNKESKRR
jgi:hypothetical protein